MSKRRKAPDYCPYCGEYNKLTLDHIIPQCIFPEDEPLPSNLPKIYACADCNNKIKSVDDSYLRDVLVINAKSAVSPVAWRVFPKFVRSINMNRSELVNDLRKSELLEHYPGSIPGMTFGKFKSEKVIERIQRIFSTVARGLYFFQTHEILPATVPIVVEFIDGIEILNRVEGFILNGNGSRFVAGDGSIFQYLYAFSPADPIDSVWVPIFYNSLQFVILTGLVAEMRREENNKLLIDTKPVVD